MNQYNPGRHIVSTFRAPASLLTDMEGCRAAFNEIIAQQQLTRVGEVYHSFEQGGFTAVVCLTESHVSIHTWPEFGIATFDVFLSNFQQDNTAKAEAFFSAVIACFDGEEINTQKLNR